MSEAVKQMSTLNHAAADAMMKVGVNACADVTGFGLLGHLRLIAAGSKATARISYGSVPLIEGVKALLDEGIAPGGTHRNLASINPDIKWHPEIDELTKLLLVDAQTSGGLLIAVSRNKLNQLLAELEAAGVETRAVIGEITDQGAFGGKLIEVTP